MYLPRDSCPVSRAALAGSPLARPRNVATDAAAADRLSFRVVARQTKKICTNTGSDDKKSNQIVADDGQTNTISPAEALVTSSSFSFLRWPGQTFVGQGVGAVDVS